MRDCDPRQNVLALDACRMLVVLAIASGREETELCHGIAHRIVCTEQTVGTSRSAAQRPSIDCLLPKVLLAPVDSVAGCFVRKSVVS